MHPALLRTGTILLLLAAAGCGQKGALYLPDKKRVPVPAGDSAAPAQAPAQSAPAQPAPAEPPPAQPAPATPSASSGS
jgi:predicted small lipoprotein YifL